MVVVLADIVNQGRGLTGFCCVFAVLRDELLKLGEQQLAHFRIRQAKLARTGAALGTLPFSIAAQGKVLGVIGGEILRV